MNHRRQAVLRSTSELLTYLLSCDAGDNMGTLQVHYLVSKKYFAQMIGFFSNSSLFSCKREKYERKQINNHFASVNTWIHLQRQWWCAILRPFIRSQFKYFRRRCIYARLSIENFPIMMAHIEINRMFIFHVPRNHWKKNFPWRYLRRYDIHTRNIDVYVNVDDKFCA